MADISRNLTPGELLYAKEIFGADLNYQEVKIHNTKAYFFQPSDTAITPDGEVYFPPDSYKADFSTKTSDAAWLIHELTHSWQHQKGMNVRIRGVINRTYEYGKLKDSERSFNSYSIEQQASIVEDYFLLTHGDQPRKGEGTLADYRRIIPFLPQGKP
jgi:hypothetical protein